MFTGGPTGVHTGMDTSSQRLASVTAAAAKRDQLPDFF